MIQLAQTPNPEPQRTFLMPGPFEMTPWLIAQNAPGASPWAGFLQFLPFVAVIGLWFYLLMIRPQQIQDKKRREMMSALKRNDRVLTTSGIYGTVLSVDDKDDRITLRIDDDKGVRAVFTKTSIVRVLERTEDKLE